MKRALISYLVLSITLLAVMIPSAAHATALMELDRLEYDFGPVKQGEELSYEFKFINRGDEDLIIENLVPS